MVLRHFWFVWLRLTPFIYLASFQYSTWYIDTLRLRTCCIFLLYIMFSTDSYCSFNPDTSKTFTFSFIVKHIGSFTGKEIIQYQIFFLLWCTFFTYFVSPIFSLFYFFFLLFFFKWYIRYIFVLSKWHARNVFFYKINHYIMKACNDVVR